MLSHLFPLIRRVGCFGLSWDERNLLEEAIKHEVNKIRTAIDIVVKLQSGNIDIKKHFVNRYETVLKQELASLLVYYIDILT